MVRTNFIPRCQINDYLIRKIKEEGISLEDVLKHLTEEDKIPYCSSCLDIECKYNMNNKKPDLLLKNT